ncbi:MAG TPA: PriCT-2 domain-containing protein [Geminicoccus sp.]|jgi:hypothetical protein|nr:PriCT-2 domain-containing protein [Geminicoccus sp.]HEX2527439.1 PriCT-2 domain-containing protein [Geminicoccus sp.]
MVAELLGDAPARIGAPPKCLWLFRTARPFPKITTAEYVLPGDLPTDKGHKVEVLGDGQQFVAFGIHPGTGRPYHWPDFSPLDLEWQDLPELSAEQAAIAVGTADELLVRAGGTLRTKRGLAPRPIGERRPGPLPRMAKGLDEVRLVLRALRRIDPNKLDYDGWVQVAYGLKAALGDRGQDVWMQWSQHSKKDEAETTERTWGWVKPERAGWRYLLKLAEAGHGR